MPKVESFKRSDVLQKASDVFHKKGYNGTSMQDLVDAMQLNRSSIYNSFGSKLELYLEVLSFYQNYHNSNFTKGLRSAFNAEEALQKIFQLNLDEILSDPDHKGCMIVNCKSEMANQEKNIQNFIENNQERMLNMFDDIVNKGQMEKVFNTRKTAEQYALYLYSSLQGLRMTGILNKDEVQLKDLMQTILHTLK